MADEFSLESVRQFIVENGGRVKNHQLVTRFKKFLNDPQNKGINRDKFKDFVNTLASVKFDHEKNEKILVLKKKYREPGMHISSSTNALLEEGSESKDAAGARARSHSLSTSSQDSINSDNVSKSISVSSEGLSSTSDRMSTSPDRMSDDTLERTIDTPERTLESQDETSKNDDLSTSAISVKERAKQLNKMQSESDLEKSVLKQGDVRSSQANGEDDDSQSGSSVSVTLDQTEREWLVTASSAEYHPLSKLLLKSPSLAHTKDFTSGFTALHWACKHGKVEVVKLLCGTHGVAVNTRSHGGYTPLHLAAMHGFEDIIELLVQVYDADPNIRDFSGKKAKQYLRNSASTRSQQLLQPRRLSTNIARRSRVLESPIQTVPEVEEAAAQQPLPFRRVGSYSAKIQKSGYLGIVAGSAVRNSWIASDSRDSSSERDRSSPSPTPPQSPGNIRRGSFNERRGLSGRDADRMPPPKGGPVRRRWTRKNKENEPRKDDEPDAQRDTDEVFEL